MEASTVDTRMARAGMQVYWLLRAGLVALPLLAGIDKFFNWTVNWPDYLAGWINDIVPGTAQDFMYFVGAVEIVAGLVVLVAPRIGGPLVAAWLAGITINLLTVSPPEYYDIALRDFGLFLAAVTFSRLAWAYHGRITALSDERRPFRRATATPAVGGPQDRA
jgi:uncharacterized membrane protein YphA (DoxX/SURF4 family)